MNETNNQRKSLSTRESRALSRLSNQGRRIVTIDDLQETLPISRKSAKDMAFTLKEKGWLERLAQGKYLILPLAAGEDAVYTEHEFVIAAALVEPMYIGYWSALNQHGLTEQVPRTVYIVTTERADPRTIHGVTYRPVTVTERKFFGYRPTAIDSEQVNLATVEKTLVDCADHPEHCGGLTELAKAMWKADRIGCDWGTVVEYLGRVGNGAATKRIVYLADVLDIDLPEYWDLVDRFTTGYPLLDPTREATGVHDSKYQLRLNVDPEMLYPDRHS